MNPAKFSVSRPVTVLMGVFAVLVLGFTAFTQLKVDLMPDITFPVVAIVTRYPGTPPEEVEEFVTKPIEEAAAIVEDLKSIRSISREGLSAVIIEFDWGKDMDWAAFNAREKVDPVIERLPADVHRPIIMKLDPATMLPIITVDVAGIQDMRRLREITNDDIKPELEKLVGVAAANIYGGLQREILVEVDRQRLRAYELPVAQVENALRSENLNVPAGFTTEGPREFTIRVVGQFSCVADISDVVVATRNDVPVYLRDLAVVTDTHKQVRSYARINGQPCVSLAIVKETTANTVEVSKVVREAIRTLPEKLPPGIELTATWDQADFIQDALHNLYGVAVEGAVLAMLIIFLFLATVRGTLVAGISIPLSVLATFVLMYFGDMTLNIITMGGLVLAIGRIVDDSVVVLENIYRHVEEGEPVIDAAIGATGELAMAIVAVTLTTMCVFFPIIFVGGMVSTLFTPMSLVVMFGLLASMVVALTVIPMLATRLMPAYHEETEPEERRQGLLLRMTGAFNRGFHAVAGWYRRAIGYCLNHRAIVTATAAGLFVASLMMVMLVGFEFFPEMDRGEMEVVVETPVGSSVEHTNEVAQQIEKFVLQIPELENVEVSLGESEGGMRSMRGGVSGIRMANFQITLVDRKERQRTTEQVETEFRDFLATIPGITSRFEETMGPGMGADVEITITGDELTVLSRLGEEALEALRDVPGLSDLRLDWEAGSPEYQVFVDRDKAGRLGLAAGDIAHTIQTLVQGTRELTKYREAGKEYDITVRAKQADREWIEVVKQTDIVAPSDAVVPLTEVATVRTVLGPTQISRDERRRSVTVEGGKSERALTEIMADVDERMQAIEWPEGYRYQFGGAEEDRQEAFAGMGLALIIGILLIYIILASLFESLVHPFTIMLAIPLEVIGVFIALLLTDTSVSIMVLMGLLMLTGIVVSNSILLVQMINILRERGLPLREAIIEGGGVRLRPILMTAIATLFAMIPLALALRAGSEMWQPLAITVIGGLITSTFLTLFVVPVAYSLFEQAGASLSRALHLSKARQ